MILASNTLHSDTGLKTHEQWQNYDQFISVSWRKFGISLMYPHDLNLQPIKFGLKKFPLQKLQMVDCYGIRMINNKLCSVYNNRLLPQLLAWLCIGPTGHCDSSRNAFLINMFYQSNCFWTTFSECNIATAIMLSIYIGYKASISYLLSTNCSLISWKVKQLISNTISKTKVLTKKIETCSGGSISASICCSLNLKCSEGSNLKNNLKTVFSLL